MSKSAEIIENELLGLLQKNSTKEDLVGYVRDNYNDIVAIYEKYGSGNIYLFEPYKQAHDNNPDFALNYEETLTSMIGDNVLFEVDY